MITAHASHPARAHSSHDIESMARELEVLDETIRAINFDLVDYYARRDQLQLRLIQTFPHVEAGDQPRRGPALIVGRFTRERAAERKPILGELDRLNRAHAPPIERRRRLKNVRTALAAAIQRALEWNRKHPQKEFALTHNDALQPTFVHDAQ